MIIVSILLGILDYVMLGVCALLRAGGQPTEGAVRRTGGQRVADAIGTCGAVALLVSDVKQFLLQTDLAAWPEAGTVGEYARSVLWSASAQGCVFYGVLCVCCIVAGRGRYHA
jgi:hypothetical protein